MPKIVNHEEQRERILKSAAEVIAERGINNVRLKDIGQQAGCTTGTLTYYFSSKEELLMAALDHAADEWQTPERQYADSLLDEIVGILPGKHSRNEWRLWIGSWSTVMFSPALKPAASRFREADQRTFIKLLKHYQEKGVLKKGINIGVEAELLRAFINGLGMSATMDESYWAQKKLRKVASDYLGKILK